MVSHAHEGETLEEKRKKGGRWLTFDYVTSLRPLRLALSMMQTQHKHLHTHSRTLVHFILCASVKHTQTDRCPLSFFDLFFLLLQGVVSDKVSHEQIGAMLMAIYLNGMTTAETVQLTKSLLYSGETLSFPEFGNLVSGPLLTGSQACASELRCSECA